VRDSITQFKPSLYENVSPGLKSSNRTRNIPNDDPIMDDTLKYNNMGDNRKKSVNK